MKLAVVTTTPEVQGFVPVALLSGAFTERLERAAQLGYDGVELMVQRPAELDGADIAAQVSYCGLEIAAIASGAIAMLDRLTLLGGDPAACAAAGQRLNQLIDFAAATRAPLVTIGGFRGRLANAVWTDVRGARAHLVAVIQNAATHAAAVGVRLALEPLNRYESDIVNNAEEGLALVEEVGHESLGLLLDTFHMNIEEAHYGTAIRSAARAGRLFHIHLGDSNRLAPGQGHLDFPTILTSLRAVDYRGYLSAELLAHPNGDAAAAKTAQHMQSLLQHLAQTCAGTPGGRFPPSAAKLEPLAAQAQEEN
jgi:sugar phosphate isomerase/epimerase